MMAGKSEFVAFGAAHIGALLVTVAAATGVTLWARRWPRHQTFIRWLLVALLAVTTALYLALEVASGQSSIWSFVPLHLCDMAIFVAIFALARRSQGAAEIVFFWTMCGTSLAMLTPDTSSSFPSWPFLFYFGLHGAVIVSAAVLVFGLGLSLRSGAHWRAWIATNLYAALVGLVNLVTGANFLYLREKPAVPTLLDHLGPWPVYVLVADVVALLLFSILYLVVRQLLPEPR